MDKAVTLQDMIDVRRDQDDRTKFPAHRGAQMAIALVDATVKNMAHRVAARVADVARNIR